MAQKKILLTKEGLEEQRRRYDELKLAEKQNGKLVYRTNCSIICVINGVEKEGKECIVDENGNVYGAKDITTTSIDDNTIKLGNSFNIPISVWNKQRMDEDPEFAKTLTDSTTETLITAT